MSTVKHAKLAEYIQLHKKNWDLDCMVVMPGEDGDLATTGVWFCKEMRASC
jgi:hypothetical protein